MEPAEPEEGPGPATAEEFEEEERTHHPIPRVKPRTTGDLGLEPPPKQRYPVRVWSGVRRLVGARELLLTFVERDLRVRYKQAVLGGVWVIAQPLMMMVIFTVVFGKIAQVGSEGLPYAVFSYCALVPWTLFSGSINYGTTSIVTNAGIIRKIALPREIFPIASVMSSSVDFGVSSVILLGMLLVYGYTPSVTWIAYPLLLLILLMVTTMVTMLASAVTVYFRDTRYAIPMLLQIGLYATPVAYPLSKLIGPNGLLHGWWAKAYIYLNPLAPIMDGFRRVLAHDQWPQWGPLLVAGTVGGVGMILSYWWYKRVDRTFADVI